MNINTVNSTNFNGYVDKSVIKYFKDRQKMLYKEALVSVKETSRTNTAAVERYNEVTKRMNETMSLLKKFMAELHPATAIKFEKANVFQDNHYLYFENDKTKTRSGNIIRLYEDRNGNAAAWRVEDNVNTIYKWINFKLKNSEAKQIDSAIFNTMLRGLEIQAEDTSIIGRLFLFFNKKKAARLAEEFGEKPSFEKIVTIEQDKIAAETKKEEAIKTFVNNAKKSKLNF